MDSSAGNAEVGGPGGEEGDGKRRPTWRALVPTCSSTWAVVAWHVLISTNLRNEENSLDPGGRATGRGLLQAAEWRLSSRQRGLNSGKRALI